MAQHPVSKMLLIEQACDRFESAWQLGDRPRIEDYLQQYPAIAANLFKPLLTLEIDYRRQRGETPKWDEYRPRFSNVEDILTELLGPHLTAEALVDQLATHAIVSSDELTSLQQRVGNSRLGQVTGENLLEELVETGSLTPFQAERLRALKGKSLAIEDYVLLEKLGQGGMGTVWKARRRDKDETVALKVLDPTLARQTEMVSRFQRESRLAIQLRHRSIVATYRAVQSGSRHFLVMEYVDGPDLSSLMKSDGPVPLSTAVEWVYQTASGLEYAHRQGIIHRDIKLANLLIDPARMIKILDLGLARIEGDEGPDGNLTATGEFMGTVDYISPEQALSAKCADARSDIYSLGMVLWFLSVGRPAYDGKSMASRILAHSTAPVPSLAEALTNSPDSQTPQRLPLDAVFRMMVAKAPAKRFQSMAQVMSALDTVYEGTLSRKFG